MLAANIRANVELWESARTIITQVTCNGQENTLRECLPRSLESDLYLRVAGLICSRLLLVVMKVCFYVCIVQIVLMEQ